MERDDSPADCSSGTICLASARRVEDLLIFYLIIYFVYKINNFYFFLFNMNKKNILKK